MKPSVPFTPDALPDALDFSRPIGIVVKPSDGFRGQLRRRRVVLSA